MEADSWQIAMLIAQLLTAGGTGGILYTLGAINAQVKSQGERLATLETIERRARPRMEVPSYGMD